MTVRIIVWYSETLIFSGDFYHTVWNSYCCNSSWLQREITSRDFNQSSLIKGALHYIFTNNFCDVLLYQIKPARVTTRFCPGRSVLISEQIYFQFKISTWNRTHSALVERGQDWTLIDGCFLFVTLDGSKYGYFASFSAGLTSLTRSRAVARGSTVKLLESWSLWNRRISPSWSLKTRLLEPTSQSSLYQLLKRFLIYCSAAIKRS